MIWSLGWLGDQWPVDSKHGETPYGRFAGPKLAALKGKAS